MSAKLSSSPVVWIGLLASVLAVGCGTKEEALGDDPAGDDDAGDDDDDSGCTEDAACASGAICDLDEDSDSYGTCSLGDRSNSPDEAVEVLLSTDLDALERVDAMIAPAGDVDFFVYASEGDEWVSIRTETDGGRDVLDTYVTVTAPDGDLHAHLDNYPTGLVSAPLDTVLYTYLPEPGDYVIAVEDVTTADVYDDLFVEEDWRGGEALTYSVHVRGAGAVGEPDAADDPATMVVLEDGNSITALGIRMEEEGDVDHVEFDLKVGGEPLEVWVQPNRPSSIADAQLDLFDGEGQLVSSKRAGAGDDGYLSYFDPEAAIYRLEASDASGGSGPDAWYVIYVRTYQPEGFHPFFGSNPYEDEAEPNDVTGEGNTPEPQPETTPDGTTYDSYRFEGRIGEAELVDPDTDLFTVTVPDGDLLSVRCFIERFGSLLVPAVSLHQAGFDLTPKGQGIDPTDTDYYVYNAEISGTVDVQLTSVLDGVVGPGAYYRCVAYVTPFEVDAGEP